MKSNSEYIISVYILFNAINNTLILNCKSTKKSVSGDEYIGIVMIDVFIILAMVYTVVRWSDEYPF